MKSNQMFNKMLDGPSGINRLLKGSFILALLVTLPLLHAVANGNATESQSENSTSLQATKEITGTVVDGEGTPIIGASIVIKGTTTGTITDIDGNFALQVPEDAETLQISFVGMLTEEVTIGTTTNFNVSLIEDLISLDELVVIGYGSVKKSDVTGAVAKVSGEDLALSTTGRVDQALQGKAAGVQVSNISSRPGGDVMIRVRGTGSINGSDPMVVIDGVQGGSLKDLNMNDVESLEVLKDASAQAIYGANAANGVIIVTTKKGKSGRLTVNYDFSYGTSKKWNDIEIANGAEWAENYNTALMNDGGRPIFDSNYYDTLPNYDWRNFNFQTGLTRNHNISISGGNEDGDFFLSYGDHYTKGIIKFSDYTKRNVRLNVNRNLYDYSNFKVKVGANLSYVYSEQRGTDGFGSGFGNGRPAMAGYAMDPLTPYYMDDDSTLNVSEYNTNPNPISRIMFASNDLPDKRQNLRAIPYISIDFLKDFNFRATYDVRLDLADNSRLLDTYVADARLRRDVNEWQQGIRKNESQRGQFILNYDKEINKHSIGVTAVYEVTSWKGNYSYGSRKDIDTETYWRPNYGSGTDLPRWDSTGGTIVVTDMVSTRGESSLNNEHNLSGINYLGRLRYGYDNRYLFTGSVRRDVTGKFGKEFTGDNFWAWSVAWNIHNESFFNVDFINTLKLRGGWGQVGNSQVPNNKQFAVMSGDVNQGFTPKREGNDKLQWETATSSNIALDMTMMNNQIAFTADMFRKNTKNMLTNPDAFLLEGFTEAKWQNLGEMLNEGLELSADYRGRVGDFSFSVGGNITFLRNEVLDLGQEGFSYEGPTLQGTGKEPIHRTEAGHPLASFYGYEVIGVYKTEEDIEQYPSLDGYGNGVIGNYIYKNNDNSDSIINANDRTYIGSPHPDFIYGINLSAEFKGFDFNAYLQGVHGNEIFSVIPFTTEDAVNYNQSKDAIANAWHPTKNPDGTRHMATFKNDLNQKPSTAWVYDGSYFRLKTVQLGYTLPSKLTEKMYIQRFRIYVSGENLLTISKYTDVGFDPELSIDPSESWKEDGSRYLGVDSGLYPSARTFTLGVNLTF